MSYHLYHTKGIVLSGANIGESNRYYHIFTKELGLLTVFAQGVRELKSKLRYHLSDLSYLSLDLIRGRDSWRVTNAERDERFPHIKKDPKKLRLLATIAQFLRRFLHGEEGNKPLFEEVLAGLSFLETASLADQELADLEVMLVARILHRLGYWGGNGDTEALLTTPFSMELLKSAAPLRSKMVREVNRALKESHL